MISVAFIPTFVFCRSSAWIERWLRKFGFTLEWMHIKGWFLTSECRQLEPVDILISVVGKAVIVILRYYAPHFFYEWLSIFFWSLPLKPSFQQSGLEWKGDMYCFFFTVQFQIEYIIEKHKRAHFNLWSFLLFYILWQNYISPFLVEIMKYLGSLFQLFSSSEKEFGNLEKYCNYFTETVFHILRASSSDYPSEGYCVFLL